MLVKVFSKEPDIQTLILRANKISRQALDTIYNLVWECEFKNILNAGNIWLKFIEEEKSPFGIELRKKRSHTKISAGDIIQVANVYYMVQDVGIRKIPVID
jgi:hypothetical protein